MKIFNYSMGLKKENLKNFLLDAFCFLAYGLGSGLWLYLDGLMVLAYAIKKC